MYEVGCDLISVYDYVLCDVAVLVKYCIVVYCVMWYGLYVHVCVCHCVGCVCIYVDGVVWLCIVGCTSARYMFDMCCVLL